MPNILPQINQSLPSYAHADALTPGTPAIANKLAPTAPPSDSNTSTTSAGDIYPYTRPKNINNHYPNYNFQNMAKEQIGKLKKPLLRFSLICNNYKFQAHIDPNHMVNNQSKRVVQLDTLTGIVLQDYGYSAQTIELRGTTGAAFYVEIEKLNAVFNNQSTAGTGPTPCTLTIEGISYTGVWRDFSFERQAQDNIYKYTIAFTVMQVGKSQNPAGDSGSIQIASKKSANALRNTTGSSKVAYVPWPGKTPASYIASVAAIPANQRFTALFFLSTNWSSAPQNKGRSFPSAPNQTLTPDEVLVVPLDWSTVLNNYLPLPSSASTASVGSGYGSNPSSAANSSSVPSYAHSVSSGYGSN